ncbi:MAG: GAF domain-containing protein [Verrucomicrobiota bacterium]|nr:GAF domain-containing protein [Verrucomicrobiota bacterium]
MDEDRQWFKSKVGVSLSETARDIFFCAHAIMNRGILIVPDAMKDPHFKNNPLVTGPQRIRSCAGAPLITPDGYALGTLCVLDKQPRQLRPEQKEALLALAHHVAPPRPRTRLRPRGRHQTTRRTRRRQRRDRPIENLAGSQPTPIHEPHKWASLIAGQGKIVM